MRARPRCPYHTYEKIYRSKVVGNSIYALKFLCNFSHIKTCIVHYVFFCSCLNHLFQLISTGSSYFLLPLLFLDVLNRMSDFLFFKKKKIRKSDNIFILLLFLVFHELTKIIHPLSWNSPACLRQVSCIYPVEIVDISILLQS